MTARKKLPSRRPLETFKFEHDGLKYLMSVGFEVDHEAKKFVPRELFLNSAQILGSATDINACDAAVAVSIALQHGVPLDDLRTAMKRNADGSPQGFVGAALDHLAHTDWPSWQRDEA
jgi:hypothetical protein